MHATPVPEPVAKFAARCGTAVATWTRGRAGVTAFALEAVSPIAPVPPIPEDWTAFQGIFQCLDRAPKGRNETGPLVAPPRHVSMQGDRWRPKLGRTARRIQNGRGAALRQVEGSAGAFALTVYGLERSQATTKNIRRGLSQLLACLRRSARGLDLPLRAQAQGEVPRPPLPSAWAGCSRALPQAPSLAATISSPLHGSRFRIAGSRHTSHT
jgi:hypothetical protein